METPQGCRRAQEQTGEEYEESTRRTRKHQASIVKHRGYLADACHVQAVLPLQLRLATRNRSVTAERRSPTRRVEGLLAGRRVGDRRPGPLGLTGYSAPIHEGPLLGGVGQVDGSRPPQLWLRL